MREKRRAKRLCPRNPNEEWSPVDLPTQADLGG